MAPTNRPRSNSYSSSVKDFQHGTKVRIIETDYVAQRTPQYIGKIGLICEVPVHPATWFKVEFPDGQIITFRPSALRCIDDIDFDDENFPTPKKTPMQTPDYVPFQNLDSSYPTIRLESIASDELISEEDGESSLSGDSNRMDRIDAKKVTNTSLDMVDADKWVGCTVKIVAGKCSNQSGKILKSGNGWIQVLTENNEDVAKRAHELLIISMSADNKVVYKKLKENVGPLSVSAPKSNQNNVGPRLGPRKSVKRSFGNGDMEENDYESDKIDHARAIELSWRKRLTESIVFSPQYNCSTPQNIRLDLCSGCGYQKPYKTSCCWNSDCISCPLYQEKRDEEIVRCKKINEVMMSPKVTVTSIMAVTPKDSFSTPLMNIVAKKPRSDSSTTDQEYNSPLTSYKCSIYEQVVPALSIPPSSVA